MVKPTRAFLYFVRFNLSRHFPKPSPCLAVRLHKCAVTFAAEIDADLIRAPS